MYKTILTAVSMLLMATNAAQAQTFDQGNQQSFCSRAGDGVWYLDSKKVAQKLIGKMYARGEIAINAGGASSFSLNVERSDIVDKNLDDLDDLYYHLEILGYEKVDFRKPSAAEVSRNPELQFESAVLLFPRGKFATIRCTKITKSTDTSEKPSGNKQKLETIFRIRGDVLDLVNPNGPKAIPAIFSINEDFKFDNTTYLADAAVGLGFRGHLTDSIKAQVIAFGHLFDNRTDKSPANNIETKSAGVILNTLVSGSLAAHDISLLADYTRDERFRKTTELATGRFIWNPVPIFGDGPLFDSLRGGAHFFDASFELNSYLRGELVYSDVINAGGSALFAAQNNYVHVGGTAGVVLDWFDADKLIFGTSINPLQKLQFFAQYKWLYGASGLLADFERLEAGGTVVLGQGDNFGITAKYVDGELDNTLQSVEFFTLAFSMKF